MVLLVSGRVRSTAHHCYHQTTSMSAVNTDMWACCQLPLSPPAIKAPVAEASSPPFHHFPLTEVSCPDQSPLASYCIESLLVDSFRLAYLRDLTLPLP
jgi:hypothetical protein